MFAALVAVAMAVSGCGGDDDGSSDAAPAVAQGPNHTVRIDDRGYEPSSLRIAVGDRVRFVNESKRTSHSAQDESRGEIDPSPESAGGTDHSGKDVNYATEIGFATHSLFPGEGQTVIFKTADTYNYYCTFHQSMRGRIEVVAKGGG